MSQTGPEPVSMEASPRVSPGPASAESGCPTPLAWQEVLASVRHFSSESTIRMGSLSLAATTIGEGKPVYFLPGLFGDHELYVLVSWLLKEECSCVMLDALREVDRSGRGDLKSLETWSTAIGELADELGHSQVHLHGCGFGGYLALDCLRRFPENFKSASLQSSFARWKLNLTERLVTSVGLRRSGLVGQSRSMMRVQTSNHRHWFPPFDGTRWEFYAANIGQTPIRDVAIRANLATQGDLLPELGSIAQPVLIIRCEGESASIQRAQAELEQGLPHPSIETLDNCGMLPHVTHPHRLVKLLRDFWEQEL